MPPSIYLAIILGKRAVVHEHTTHYERRRKLLPQVLSRIAIHRAAAIIGVSEAARDMIAKGLGRQSNLFVLPNFVPKLPEATDTTFGKANLLMVAAFRRPKRQDALIRALPFLPEEFRLSFAGDGPTLPECRELAEQLSVAHRVTFLGSVRGISEHYANARLCVLLSEWEGFGLVVLEAAHFGKVTVVSDIEALRECCVDKRLLFAGSNAEKLADKLLEVADFCEDQATQQQLSIMVANHDFSRYVERLNEMYGSFHELN